MYQEIMPNLRLSGLIQSYWVTEGFLDGIELTRILPDGCVDIIINTKDSYNWQSYKPNIVGTMTSYIDFPFTRNVKILGIRFNPGGITAFTRVPVHEFTDKQIEISLVETLFTEHFCEELAAISDTLLQINFIENYLLQNLFHAYNIDNQIVEATKCISSSNGTIPIKELSAKVCLCQRQLERRFKTVTGVSPKMFSRIMRFNYARKQLSYNPKAGLFLTAIDCGYYDHSHLTKEFEQFSGNLPIESI